MSGRAAGEFACARERLAPLPGAMRVRYSGGCAGPAGTWVTRAVESGSPGLYLQPFMAGSAGDLLGGGEV